MNTKGMKFLAVLAVLAMAFAAFAVVAPADDNDAAVAPAVTAATVGGEDKFDDISNDDADNKLTLSGEGPYSIVGTVGVYTIVKGATYTDPVMDYLEENSVRGGDLSFVVIDFDTEATYYKVGTGGAWTGLNAEKTVGVILTDATDSGSFTVSFANSAEPEAEVVTAVEFNYILFDASEAYYDADTTAINAGTYEAAGKNVIVSNAAVTTAEIPAGKVLQILNDTALTEITLGGNGSKVLYSASDKSGVTINGGTGNSVSLTSFFGDLEMTYGSVDITGEDMHGTITVQGDVTLAGSISGGNLTVNKANDKNAEINIGNLTIADGCKLILNAYDDTADTYYMKAFISDEAKVTLGAASEIDLQNTAILTISGKVDGNTGIISVGGEDGDATLFVDTGAVVASKILGNGTIYMDDAYMEFEVARDVVSTITTTAQQKVTIVNNITIYSGNCLDIAGWLVIPEGVKLTIEDGAYLQVAGPIAKADIYGDVVIKGDNGFRFSGLELNVYGDITVKNESTTTSAITVDFYNDAAADNVAEISGSLTVNNSGYVDFDNLTVTDLGTVTINGTAKDVLINYGNVVMKGTSDNFTVKQQNEAIVSVQSVSGTITITDSDLVMNGATVSTLAPEDNGGYTPATNTLTFTDAKGLAVYSDYKVTASTYDGHEGEKVYTNYMYISGSLSKDRSTTTDLLNISAGTVTVKDTLNLGAVDMDIDNGAAVYVSGTIISTDEDTAITGSGTGILTVPGLVKLRNAIITTDVVINAVHYIDNSGEVTYYIYTNLGDAIASGFEDFEVYGTLYITKDTTVPAGISIECEGIVIYEGATFVIADGAELEANSTIYVYGTFEIENRDDVTHRTVISDIESKTETTERYTNLYTALQKAVAGEKVRLTKTDSNVVLSKDAEIKEGVILEVPVNRTLEIAAGVTLTVNGTLNLNNGKLTYGAAPNNETGYTDGKFATAASYKASVTQTNLFSCVKIGTGEIVSTEQLSFNSYMIPGAYYQVKNKYYITTIEQSALDITIAVDKKVDVYGDVSATTAIFTGLSNDPATVTFKKTAEIASFWSDGKSFAAGVLSAGDLTVINGKFVFDNGYKATGTFTAETGTIKFTSSIFGASTEFGDMEYNDATVAYVKGTVDVIDINKGIVYVPAIGVGAELTTATDKSKLTIASGATLYVVGDVSNNVKDTTIEGTLYIADGGSYTAQKGDHTLKTISKGIVEIKAGGAFNVDLLYVGTAPKTTSDGAAILGSEVSDFTAIVVYPGASISAEIIKDLKAMTYTVEGKLYATAYAKNDTATINGVIKSTDIKVVNGVAVKWVYDKDDKDANAGKIYDAKNVHLSVNYEIYKIIVTTEPGVDAVYLNGKLMTATGDKNKGITFEMTDLIAGTYAVSWQLANGYSDDNVELYINGEKSTLMSVTTSGDKVVDGYKTYNLVLQGVEKSGYVEPESPVEPETWTVTTILLVILVILIAIMAVIVALRLNRS